MLESGMNLKYHIFYYNVEQPFCFTKEYNVPSYEYDGTQSWPLSLLRRLHTWPLCSTS